MAKQVEFWFEFASTYSYLSAMRIDDLARSSGVKTVWKPFRLGPIFQSQGWETSPFNIYKAKGEYMWRDMARRAGRYGLPFQQPDTPDGPGFPQTGLHAARIAIVGLDQGWGREFCRQVYASQFAKGALISDIDFLSDLARSLGAPENVLELATSADTKAHLRSNVETAQSKGLFGAPSFLVGDELFWGDDRLKDALDWATKA